MALTWNHKVLMTASTYYEEGECLSTDTKPTGADVANGSKLLELDTSTLYIYDAENQQWRAWE